MSVQEAGGSEEPVHILTVHMSPSLDTAQRCNVRVRRHTTATLVLENLVKHFHLDKARNYELVEVREPGAGARALQAGERPVEHMLLWPQGHEQSRGFYFTLQEGQRDTMKDLCGLAALNEKNVLEALRRRFYSKQIYTYAGDILLAINPFQFLPIYNPKDVEMYQNRALGQKEPHVFAVADAAFHAMLSKRTNQCIVISGESGSGKTQSTKFIIHCLTALSRKGCTSGVERTILGAGPVLEAFGNAKTSYNNNSSRFGKFIRVNFLEGGVVRGATIETYLLEKSRLVTRRSSERNYHVFYYLLLGATQEEREEFRLLEPEQYHYLKQDDPQLEDEVVMKDEFKRLHQAMELVGFLPPTRKQILSVLSAILYLGNVTYTTKPGGDGVTVGPPDVLQTLSDLLKVKVELLATALTKRKAMTANDVLILPYTLSQAVTARDSVAKSLYSSMFDWIVLRINHALLNKRDVEEAVPCLSIGVLDIFGFEDVRSNSFEQFCINYANEQLQHYCTQHIFRLEQEEYGAEGISWTPVDYCDNEGCISLVSKKPTGLLYLLDEESSLPQATDATLLEKFKQQHQENRFFVPTPVLEPAFIIRHYAGKVKYQIEDFRAKNTDHMRPDIVSLLRGSQSAYLRRLMGSNPVAVFRWGILRAVVRIVNTFKTAGKLWASKNPDLIRRYSRLSLSETRRPSYAVGRLMSQRSLIEFSFDHSEENPLEVLEDIFATFESKKYLHAKILRSVSQAGGKPPLKVRLASVSDRKLRRFHPKSRSSKRKQIIPKNLIDCASLKLIVNLNLHNHDSRALLHLHKKKKPPSISAQFQMSLMKLLEMLRRSEPFFIRCIRSNAQKTEMHFDDDLVLVQLRYSGMLQTINIKQSGYSTKFTFKEFTDEFRILLPKRSSSPQTEIPKLLHRIGIQQQNFQIGKTKVFLKERDKQTLQETLYNEMTRRILILQRWFRACLARKHFLMKRRAVILVQRSWRVYHRSTRYQAALVIQSAWKESRHRAEYLRQRESFKKLQQLQNNSERRRLKEQQVRREEVWRGESSTDEINEAPTPPPPPVYPPPPPSLPRQPPIPSMPQIPSMPPIPAQRSLDNRPPKRPPNEAPQNRNPDQERQNVQNQRDKKEEPKRSGVSTLSLPPLPPPPAQPRPNSLYLEISPYSDGGSSPPTLQRSRPADMEKVERWRERRSDIGVLDNQKLLKLKAQGTSRSLNNLHDLSSSESDSSHTPVTLRRYKRTRHRPRLAHARSGLVLMSGEPSDLEFWSFPLPPISPSAGSLRVGAPAVLGKSQLPAELDGGKLSTTKRETDAGYTQEKSGFFNRYFGQKKRQTPQDGNVTMVKALAEKEDQVRSPHSSSPSSLGPLSLAKRKRSIKISRGTRVTDKGEASLDRQITDSAELRHLDEFLGSQMTDLQSRVKKLSETEVIFLTATKEFRDTIKSMYSLSNLRISYKGLLQGYKSKVASLAAQKKKDEVPLVVNLFQSVLDGFIRAEIKRANSETELVRVQHTKNLKRTRENDKCPDSPLDHSFSTYQVNIVQSCDSCGSFIWGMEKACMCSSCKMVCHRKCMSKILTTCSKPVFKKAEVSCFGVDLSALSSGGPPAVLEMMLAHVEMTGLYTEGIYRKSGSACKAKELHQLLESDYKKTRLDNYQIHTVTGLIKSWLRELPEPLMTFRLYNDFMYAAEIPERSERLRAIYRKLEELPAPNYGTLERLIFHLVRVAKEEPHNRMSGNALSIVFAPCILRSADMSDPLLSFKDLPKTTLCLEVLILEQMRRYEEKMKEIQQLEHAEALAIKELKLRRQNTILENPKDTLNVPPVDESVMDEEKTLMERIKSLKHEKNKLAYRLPELDQDASDNETLDSESIASLESPLDDSLVLEGRWNTKEPQKRPVQAGGGVRDGYVSTAMPASNQAVKPSGSVISLDIPYIDDDL